MKEIERAKLLVTLQTQEHLYVKGTMLERPIPSDIVAEIKAGTGTVEVVYGEEPSVNFDTDTTINEQGISETIPSLSPVSPAEDIASDAPEKPTGNEEPSPDEGAETPVLKRRRGTRVR